MSNLSLFGIESALHELMTLWQEAETPEAMAAAEAAIRDYAEAEIRKVDGIRRYDRLCSAMSAAAKAEADIQKARQKLFEARQLRLRAIVYEVMKQHGLTKLEGNTGTLQIKGNGGQQPLMITDESLVPDMLCVWQGEIDGAAWIDLSRFMADHRHCIRMVRTPNKPAIRAVLESRCKECSGSGGKGVACGMCGGTGKGSVAGARLDPRGDHLEIK